MNDRNEVIAFASMMLEELSLADKKHPPMDGMFEGLHTLKCEVAELEREVMRKNTNKQEMLNEAVQVGAMAIKFIRDCIDLKTDKNENNIEK